MSNFVPGFGQIKFSIIDAPGGVGIWYDVGTLVDLQVLSDQGQARFYALLNGWNAIVDGIPDASSGSANLTRDAYVFQPTNSTAETTISGSSGFYTLAFGNGDNKVMVDDQRLVNAFVFTGGGDDEVTRAGFADLGPGNDKGALLGYGVLLGREGNDTLSSYSVNGRPDTVVLDGGSGDNTIVATADTADVVYIRGENGQDTISVFGSGTFVLDLGLGFNTVQSDGAGGQRIILVDPGQVFDWQDLGSTSLTVAKSGTSSSVSVEVLGDISAFTTGLRVDGDGDLFTAANFFLQSGGHFFTVLAEGYLPVGLDYQEVAPGEVFDALANYPHIGAYAYGADYM